MQISIKCTVQLLVIICSIIFISVNTHADKLTDNYNMLWQVELDDINKSNIYWKDCISLIHTWKFLNYSKTDHEKYIHYAKKNSLKIIVYLGKNIANDENGCYFDEYATQFITDNLDSEEIFAWHVYDEPKGKNIDNKCQQQLYEQVKNIDPERHIFVSTNISTHGDFKKYFNTESLNILDVHKYVNPEFGPKQIRQLKLADYYLSENIPLIVTLRAFNKRPPNFKRKEMIDNSILEQIQGYIEVGVDINGFGFYGWNLIRNEGITKSQMIEDQFIEALNYMRDNGLCNK